MRAALVFGTNAQNVHDQKPWKIIMSMVFEQNLKVCRNSFFELQPNPFLVKIAMAIIAYEALIVFKKLITNSFHSLGYS